MKEGKSCTTTWKRIPQNCKIKSSEKKKAVFENHKTKFPQIIQKKSLMLNKFENSSVTSVENSFDTWQNMDALWTALKTCLQSIEFVQYMMNYCFQTMINSKTETNTGKNQESISDW